MSNADFCKKAICLIYMTVAFWCIESQAQNRFQPYRRGDRINSAAAHKMYMRTRKILLRAGNLCKVYKRQQQLFSKAVQYQLVARYIFIGKIYRPQRNRLAALITLKARHYAENVITANFGRLSWQEKKTRSERMLLQRFPEHTVQNEVARATAQLHLRMPPLNQLLSDYYFYLGSKRTLQQQFRYFRR